MKKVTKSTKYFKTKELLVKLSGNLNLITESSLTSLKKASTTILAGLEKSGDFVVDGFSGSAGYIKDNIYYIGGQALEGSIKVKHGIVSVGDKIVGSLINTKKFLSDSNYRTSEGLPWLKSIINNNKEIILYQMKKNKDALEIVYQYSLGEELEESDKKMAIEQMTEMAKIIPAFAIFLLPGGLILLPTLARLLPWELIPDLKPPENK